MDRHGPHGHERRHNRIRTRAHAHTHTHMHTCACSHSVQSLLTHWNPQFPIAQSIMAARSDIAHCDRGAQTEEGTILHWMFLGTACTFVTFGQLCQVKTFGRPWTQGAYTKFWNASQKFSLTDHNGHSVSVVYLQCSGWHRREASVDFH